MAEATEPRPIDMVVALDEALHGKTWARPYTPEHVWDTLLREVRDLARFRERVMRAVQLTAPECADDE